MSEDRQLKIEGNRSGLEYWRSLEELADTPAFQELLHREFPNSASEFPDPAGRRRFLKLMGASLAFAGLTACTRQPAEKIAPYTRQPEDLIPGRPQFYATAMPLAGIGTGVLVESHEGRPTKIEGHPDHPASLGASDVYAQASILGLYDPDRSRALIHLGEIGRSGWPAFLGTVRPALAVQKSLKGAGFRILTGSVTSPTLASQIRSLLDELPLAKWHQYEPAGRGNALEGARMAFGEYVNAVYRIDKADVILSLDSEFLTTGPSHLRYAREFAARRRLESGNRTMNRLYAVESTPTATGASADHRFSLRASQIESFAREMAYEVGARKAQNEAETAPPSLGTARGIRELVHAVRAIGRDLREHRGSSLIIAGDSQPPAVHALAHAMNFALGNVGNTLVYTDPIEASPTDGMASLGELVRDIEAGQVDMLVILGGNPVYTAPADLNFAESLKKVRLRVHLGLYEDETAELCQWHVPEAHYLESWSDVRAFDGTISIIQPLIAPLYNGRTAHELLAAFSDQPERTSYEIVRGYWMGMRGQGDSAEFEKFWRRSLHDGLIADSALPAKNAALRADWQTRVVEASSKPATTSDTASFEINFRPDPTVFDGQFANNGWLQELPKPLSKLTWDNAALISRATAERLGLKNEVNGLSGEIIADQIEIEYEGRRLVAPVWITPGQPDDSVTLHLGYGRSKAGRIGSGAGFNANAIRASGAPWFASGAQVRKTDDTSRLAVTQLHYLIEGRDILRSGSLERYKEHPSLAPEHPGGEHKDLSLYEPHAYNGYAWGMTIDLNSCIGCNACVVACQSENNIPVVGKEQVLRGREMHWLRVDSYFKGDDANPETHFQPVPCMHCENAPCEVVCPVAATVHSAEGLNDMVYNRCVGTRYCSNNCPYKVRRFNFFLYQDWDTPTFQMMRNPDVTVRSRGVMEKCTYCVQRIQRAKITAEKENRPVRDGEIVTACEAVCPTRAITFGNVNDPESRVSKLKGEPRNYGLLAELNTKPRTTYLGAVRNRNRELEES